MLWFLCVCSAQHSLKRAALICGFTLCVSSAQHKLKGAALDLPIALLCVCALHSTNWKESQCIYLLLYFVCVLCTAQTEKNHSVLTYWFTLCVCSAQHKLKRVAVDLPVALLCVSAQRVAQQHQSYCVAPMTSCATRWSAPYTMRCVLWGVCWSPRLLWSGEVQWKQHSPYTWKISPHRWWASFLHTIYPPPPLHVQLQWCW